MLWAQENPGKSLTAPPKGCIILVQAHVHVIQEAAMGKRRRKTELPDLALSPGKGLSPQERRNASLTIRLTPTERRQIQDMADRFGTTVTNYLLNLHAQAWASIKKEGGK